MPSVRMKTPRSLLGSYSISEAVRKIHCTVFGLNLNLYPSPPVSFFSSCGHHNSILSPELSILRCVVVKIATGSALAHQVQPVYVIRKMAPPIVQNMYKTMSFFKTTETFMGFSSICFSKIHQLHYIKPYKS